MNNRTRFERYIYGEWRPIDPLFWSLVLADICLGLTFGLALLHPPIQCLRPFCWSSGAATIVFATCSLFVVRKRSALRKREREEGIAERAKEMRERNAARFREIFGAEYAEPGDPELGVSRQNLIDMELTSRARKFNEACVVQESFLNSPAQTSSTASEILKEASRLGNKVQTSRAFFWQAHNFAKDRGFQVRLSFKEYL